jgi:hypothetical protein
VVVWTDKNLVVVKYTIVFIGIISIHAITMVTMSITMDTTMFVEISIDSRVFFYTPQRMLQTWKITTQLVM